MKPVEIDIRDLTVTPVFKHVELEDVPASEAEGRKVMRMHEVVEVRIGGSKNYSPVFPAAGFWRREGLDTITYAERWPDQYATFKAGDTQEAHGTPLQMLREYGITPEQLSLCRALKIYSIEAMDQLEGPNLKSLGMHQNELKAAAREFLADRGKGMQAVERIAALEAELAALRAIPKDETPPEEIERLLSAADDAYPGVSDSELKDRIEKLAGTRPKGNPSRNTLMSALAELEQAA